MSKPNLDDFYAAVVFMDGNKVSRQMRFKEFEAFLDGYVGLSDLADTEVRAVLVLTDHQLQIRSLVFFRLYFDDEGRADPGWNIPIERLALTGARGPDLGCGEVRLVCRSQCPEPGWAEALWDPDMSPSGNQFQVIRRAIESNRLGFDVLPVLQPEIPTLQADSPQDLAHQPGMSDARERRFRLRMARRLKVLRLRVRTLISAHRDEVEDIRRDQRLQQQMQRRELEAAGQVTQRVLVQNEQLTRRLAEQEKIAYGEQQQLRMQVQKLQDAAAQQVLPPEMVPQLLWEERLERKQREIDRLQREVASLRSQLEEARARLQQGSAMERNLQELGLFLVAYHPGVGHTSIAFEDLPHYRENPLAYAAERCGVSEEGYRLWLQHHEHPRCHHVFPDGRLCGRPVPRVSQPAHFMEGLGDRCHDHRA